MKDDKKLLWGSDKNAVIACMAIVLVVFVFFRMMYIIFQNNPFTLDREYSELIQQFALPLKWELFLSKPWTLLTHFITNIRFVELITNLIWLAGFSFLVQQLVGNRFVVPVFLYGGVVSGIVLLLTPFIITPSSQYALGSSAAITSLATLLCYHSPRHKLMPEIKTGMPVWLLYILFIVVVLTVIINKDIFFLPAHLAAMLTGLTCGMAIKKGKHVGAWMHKAYQTILGK